MTGLRTRIWLGGAVIALLAAGAAQAAGKDGGHADPFAPILLELAVVVLAAGAVGINIVLTGRGLPVHDPSLPNVLLAIGCAVGARECARLVAIAHPTQARVALKERQELSG